MEQGSPHQIVVRMYYEDTDVSGVVYHAKYLHFMERGRSEFFRACGAMAPDAEKNRESLFWTIRSLEVEYVHPARINDLIIVQTKVQRLTGVRLSLEHTLLRQEVVLTRGTVELCLIDRLGKVQRIPKDIYDNLAQSTLTIG